jgi:ABC-type sugar transport system ATPase subunit
MMVWKAGYTLVRKVGQGEATGVIHIDDLSIRVGAFALTGLSLRVDQGQYAVLMGRTGSGKTTLLEVIAGLRPVRAGALHLLGQDVTRLRPAERGVGYVPQDLALFPSLTVHEHLAFALTVRRWSTDALLRRVAEMSELLGLSHLLQRRPEGLSGGEAQRVALGRALAFGPRILLLDEPLSALDETTREEMHVLLRLVQRRTGVTTLHVTHSRTEANRLADRLFLLHNGNIEEQPLPGALSATQAVREAD